MTLYYVTNGLQYKGAPHEHTGNYEANIIEVYSSSATLTLNPGFNGNDYFHLSYFTLTGEVHSWQVVPNAGAIPLDTYTISVHSAETSEDLEIVIPVTFGFSPTATIWQVKSAIINSLSTAFINAKDYLLMQSGASVASPLFTGKTITDFKIATDTFNAPSSSSTAYAALTVLDEITGERTFLSDSFTVPTNWSKAGNEIIPEGSPTGMSSTAFDEACWLVTANATGSFSYRLKYNGVNSGVITATSSLIVLQSQLSSLWGTPVELASTGGDVPRSFFIRFPNGTPTDKVAGTRTIGTIATKFIDGRNHHYGLSPETTASRITFNRVGSPDINYNIGLDMQTDGMRLVNFQSGSTWDNWYPAAPFIPYSTQLADLVNVAPSDVFLSNSTIAENSPSGTTVGTFSTTDADPSNTTFDYTLVSGTGSTNNDSFSIEGNVLKSASLTSGSYSVLVRSTDHGGLYIEKQFSITVTSSGVALPTTDVAVVDGGVVVAAITVDPTTIPVTVNGQPLPDGSILRNTTTGQKFYKISGGVSNYLPIPVIPDPTWSFGSTVDEAWEILQNK